ncbi:MAG TPA: hypothetical protein EYH19_02360 [Desulfocapsa sulfexigens]|nr:hypothetical protein [Desulfocapsa sulfexigens]
MVPLSPLYLCLSNPILNSTRLIQKMLNMETVFFSSRQMGEILAKGCFPSLYSGIDNGLPDEASFQWVGWDFLSKMDSGSIIPQVYDLFDAEMGSR